jgi:site-specific DNA recombinase
MKKIGLYARVSPGRQEQELTIESQVAAIEAHVSAMRGVLDPEHRYIDNGWTSDSLLRPGLEALRDAVALGSLDCVVLYDPDRLSRRFVDQQVVLEEIERKHVEVIFLVGGVARTDEERMALQMRGVFAEYERAKIRERTRRGRLYRARAGAPPGWPNPPYGLRLLRGQRPEPATVVVEACEANVVHQMFEWVDLERLRLRQVSQRLEQLGIKPRSGARWAVSTLLGILRNPLYTGQAHHQKYESIEPKQPRTHGRFRRRRKTSYRKRPEQEWIGVRVPAIVDQALFDRVQQVLVDNRRQTAGQATHPYLLRGLLLCSACGRTMWGRGVDFGTPYERRYYGCNGHDRLAPRFAHRCPSRPVRAEDVEQVVWEDLAHWLQEPEQLAAQLEAQRDTIRTVLDAYAAEQRRFAREMRALTQAVERLVDAYQAGAISLEELGARREHLEENKQRCQARAAQAERQYQQAHARQQVVDELRQLKERLRRGLERCTWEDRRAIVELLVEKVVVAEPKLVVHYIVPLGRAGTPPTPTPSTEPISSNFTRSNGGAELTSEQAAQPSAGLCRPCPRTLAHARGSESLHETTRRTAW